MPKRLSDSYQNRLKKISELYIFLFQKTDQKLAKILFFNDLLRMIPMNQ